VTARLLQLPPQVITAVVAVAGHLRQRLPWQAVVAVEMVAELPPPQ